MHLNTELKRNFIYYKNLQERSLISKKKIMFIDKYLLPKLEKEIKNKFSKSINRKIMDCSKEVFLYFNNYNIEEVYLLVKKINKKWFIEVKVFPSYEVDIELKKYSFVISNFSSDNYKFLLNLKEYYLKNLKQVVF